MKNFKIIWQKEGTCSSSLTGSPYAWLRGRWGKRKGVLTENFPFLPPSRLPLGERGEGKAIDILCLIYIQEWCLLDNMPPPEISMWSEKQMFNWLFNSLVSAQMPLPKREARAWIVAEKAKSSSTCWKCQMFIDTFFQIKIFNLSISIRCHKVIRCPHLPGWPMCSMQGSNYMSGREKKMPSVEIYIRFF